MKKNNKTIKAVITSVLAFAAGSTMVVATDVMAATELEKCYGVAKAGKNDCQTSTHSCAGTTTKDSQGDAFILVPAGVCEKITNGSLTLKSDSAPK